MASWDVLLAFALATAVFAYFPGPALLYTAAQTIARGRRAGLMAALGIHIGCYAHVLGAAFGLSAIFKFVPELFVAMKLCGALYLVWLGIGLVRSRLDGGDASAGPPKTTLRAFLDSILVEILNPKVAIFFIAFLPQFVDPAASLPVWLQFLILGTIVNIAFSSADLIVVFSASAMLAGIRRSSSMQTVIRWLGGTLLIGLGVKLAAERT
jgi:threonine/homoserine/homoserine lactone efflux protein